MPVPLRMQFRIHTAIEDARSVVEGLIVWCERLNI